MAVIAVDCGGTKVVFARVEAPADAEPAGMVATPREAAAIPAVVAAAVSRLVDGSVTAIGIGAAGLVDRGRGRLVWSPHSTGGRVPLAVEVAAATGRPVVVDNDANLAVLAEARLGAGAGHRMVLLVALGTGIGGGLAVEGVVERGRGFLGEVGHMVMDPSGPACVCGRRGCWEALVSGTSLGRAARELAGSQLEGAVARAAAGGRPRGEHLSEAARAGDPAAGAALAEAGGWLGRGLANLVAVLDPDVIVLGGGVAGAGEMLMGPARKVLAASVAGKGYRSPTPVVAARFGSRAGLVGAALAAEEAQW
jgi:glucokinase